jgi:hypothetical protein
VPWFLQVAIEHALTILGWFENLQKEEVPPEHIWEDGEGLDEWFASVKAKRDQEFGITDSSYQRGDPDDIGEWGSPEQQGPGIAENDYARALKNG